MRVWRVVPRVDNQGNHWWSLQYDTVYRDRKSYELWEEDRVFRDLDMALADLAYVREQETSQEKK